MTETKFASIPSSATTKVVSTDLSKFASASMVAVGLAIAAVVGRFTAFVVGSSMSMPVLVPLQIVAVAALVAAHVASSDDTGWTERTLVRFATRIAFVQVVLGLALITVALV